jgi:hypothetical protein
MAEVIVSFNEHQMVALAETASEQAVTVAMRFLEHEANKTCPFEDGNLEGSSRVEVSQGSNGQAEGQVTYNTKYARYQHETLSLHHKGKGRAKWLELTMIEQRAKLGQIMAQEFERRMSA